MKREAQKALKQAKEEELQKICKESLEADKKSQRKSKGKLKKDGSASPTTPAPTTVPSSPTKSPTTPPSAGCRHRMNPFKTSLQPMAPTPDLGESDSEEEEMVIKKDIPWHEQQLYKLYGKNADYFLHPKIENKTQVKKSNPKLRRQGGRAGADILWQTLRQDSNQRLLQEDATIPKQLKDAYGAFARQSLRKNRIPVQRMFCEENDLPEMPRLLNNEKLKEVKKMRHKTDLMYRASVANQDRTEVLKFNNPMPEFGEGGVSEYLPSWYDDISEDSVPEYMRWLMASAGGQGLENVEEEVEEDSQLKPTAPPSQLKPTAPQLTQSMDDNLVQYMRRKPQATKPKQKYVFLTDKDTESQGVFSEKYKGERENKDIPQPYKGDLPKSMSAMGGMISATPDPVSKSVTMTPYSAPQHRHENQRPIQTTWQPLSMHALVEYKKQVDTTGAGDFNMGRTKMWSQIPVI